MAKEEYKALFVKEDTHHEVKVLSVKEKLTIDETIQKITNFYQANQTTLTKKT